MMKKKIKRRATPKALDVTDIGRAIAMLAFSNILESWWPLVKANKRTKSTNTKHMGLTKKEMAAVSMAKASKAEQSRLERVWPDVHWALTAIQARVKNPVVKMVIGTVLGLATGILGEPQEAKA